METTEQTTDRRLTNSSEATFMTCQRKYALAYVLRLRPRHDADPLRFGTAWHLGVGMYESGIPIDDAIEAVREAYAASECPPWLTPEDMQVECETVCAMTRGHHWRWGSDPAIETVMVEHEFNLPIINPATGRPTPTYTSAGKMDRIGKLTDGRLALVERKTTRDEIAPESDYWKKLLMDSQLSRYYCAARDSGFDVQTIMYDVMRKPSIRPKKVAKSDVAQATAAGCYFGLPLTDRCPEQETPAMYGARLLADIQERPDFYLARREIPRMAADLAEFRQEQWTILHQIRECEVQQEQGAGLTAWPRNTRSCVGFGRCPYLDICRGLTADPTQQIPEGFEIRSTLHSELSPIDE
jgi:hypothetical protein